jgi:hypothetical protein
MPHGACVMCESISIEHKDGEDAEYYFDVDGIGLTQTLGVSVMKPQLCNQQVITFYAVHHAMFICYAA